MINQHMEDYEMISIIVPVYNVRREIEKCIDGLIQQTYDNIEIVIIDDGSDSGTAEILDRLSTKDSRIKLFHCKNQGAAKARLTGVSYASGNYIMFCDADDYYDIDACEILIDTIKKNEVDIAICGYRKYDIHGEIHEFFGNGEISIYDSESLMICYLNGKHFTGSLWAKIYKKSLFENFIYNCDVQMNEDLLINYYLFKKASSAAFLNIAKYNYVVRSTSTCETIEKNKIGYDGLIVSKLIFQDAIGSVYEPIAEERYVRSLIYNYRLAYKVEKSKCIEYKKLIDDLELKFKIRSKKLKISLWMIKYVPACYQVVYSVYDKIREPNWDI